MRPPVRLVILCVLLTLGGGLMLVQLMAHRTQLSAYPALTLALTRLCQPWGCDPVLPQRAEALVIEASSLDPVDDHTYRLQLTLRHTARSPVAVPALELTLTDANAAVVLRRVISAKDVAQAADLKDAMLMPQVPVHITQGVSLTAQTPVVAGYRLLAFYP